MKNKAVISLVGVLLALMTVTPGHAEVYRCVDSAGKVEYSNIACANAASSKSIRAQPNTIDSSGSREQALIQENLRLKDLMQSSREQPAQETRGRTQSDLQAERIDRAACERARREYEVAASSITGSQATLAARRSAMYGACGMREPDKTNVNVRINNNRF